MTIGPRLPTFDHWGAFDQWATEPLLLPNDQRRHVAAAAAARSPADRRSPAAGSGPRPGPEPAAHKGVTAGVGASILSRADDLLASASAAMVLCGGEASMPKVSSRFFVCECARARVCVFVTESV